MLGYLGTTGCHVISLILLVFVTVTDKGERIVERSHSGSVDDGSYESGYHMSDRDGFVY